MKNFLFLFLFFVLIFWVGFANNFFINNEKTVSLNKDWQVAQLPYSDSAICTLKISTVVNFNKDHIGGEINIDDNPMTLTFIDINTEIPSIIGNLGDKVSLAKIDNGSTVYLVEQTDFGNINVFTFFRDKNIMIMSKQYDLLGEPFGLMMIGDCLSGI